MTHEQIVKAVSIDSIDVSTNALTVEQVKALPVGEWIWLVDKENHRDLYVQLVLRPEGLVFWGRNYYEVPDYLKYGETWVAYKNKERQFEINPTPPVLVGDKVYYPNFNVFRDEWEVCEGTVSLVLQTKDGEWQFRFSYKSEFCRNKYAPSPKFHMGTYQCQLSVRDICSKVFLSRATAEVYLRDVHGAKLPVRFTEGSKEGD